MESDAIYAWHVERDARWSFLEDLNDWDERFLQWLADKPYVPLDILREFHALRGGLLKGLRNHILVPPAPTLRWE
jgi:hypothetical protein